MQLIDSDRRYVAVNDATVEFYGLPREELVGREPGRTLVRPERAAARAEWEILRNTGEIYSDRVVQRTDGRRLRIRYVAHASATGGRWLALVVILSARVEPNGPELISPAAAATEADPRPPARPRLTPREREVVRLVALGATNREIADQLYLSPETVRSHARNAMGKTGARTRAHLVAISLSERLLEDSAVPVTSAPRRSS